MAVAANTFREAIRDRVLYLFLGFAVSLLGCSKLCGMLTGGDEGKVSKDLGRAGIQFFSMLIAVMMSVLLISREVESRTVFNILAKPVRRWQFLIGKYLGLLMTVAVNLGLMVGLLVAVVWIYQREFDPGLLLAGAMTMLEMALLTAFATLFSVLTKHLKAAGTRPLIAAVYYVLPTLERFNFKTEVVHDLASPLPAVGWAVVYGLAYTSLVLLLACLRFGRRDLV